MTALNSFNTNLAAEAQAVTLANANLIAVTYSTPKDEAKVVAANTALAMARTRRTQPAHGQARRWSQWREKQRLQLHKEANQWVKPTFRKGWELTL